MKDLFPSITLEEANQRMLKAIPHKLIERWCNEADEVLEKDVEKVSLHDLIMSGYFIQEVPRERLERCLTPDGYQFSELCKILRVWLFEQSRASFRVSYVESRVSELLKAVEKEDGRPIPVSQ